MATTRDLNDKDDDGGLAIVRIKPIGAGGGGVEKSGEGFYDGEAGLRYHASDDDDHDDGRGCRVDIVAGSKCQAKSYTYMRHVIPPSTDNEGLYDAFMPHRVDAFLNGINVNVMAYGQTGTGKTHTMFGTPGIMEQAGRGDFGAYVTDNYGIFPRAVLDIFARVQELNNNHASDGGDQPCYVLTASAVELSMFGNVDMMNKPPPGESNKSEGWGGACREVQYGVCLDKAAKPPKLYGMENLVLETESDVLRVFSAIATRNTAGTGLNDSSSRTHCFAFLTLHKYDTNNETISASRFQFVDLAGNERIEQSSGNSDYRATQAGITGMITNYSLTMLSAAVRGLVDSRKNKQKKFSFRSYLFDLVLLLSESMTGSALTAVFVCVSQAPANSGITSNALDFGEVFSQLTVHKKEVPAVPAKKIEKAARDLLAQAERALINNQSERYVAIRKGQIKDCHQQLDVLSKLGVTTSS